MNESLLDIVEVPLKKMEITHKHLVEKAKFYLSSAKQCNPVFTEKGSARIHEYPDVIGWTGNECFVLECKASLSDLKADAKKESRSESGRGLGNRRYYFLPQELYEQIQNKLHECIPKGWGVIICFDNMNPRQVRHRDSKVFGSNIKAERDFLRSRVMEIQRFGR